MRLPRGSRLSGVGVVQRAATNIFSTVSTGEFQLGPFNLTAARGLRYK